MQRLGAKKALLITDPFLRRNGMADNIAARLKDIGVDSVIYDEVAAEPPLALAQSLVDFTRAQAADLVIGLGGGSALDLAKLAAVFADQDGEL